MAAFWECYSHLHELRSLAPRVPMIALTATATKLTKDTILNVLPMDDPYEITVLIILPWTPKICLECLLCCNQSHARSSHHRNHGQRRVSYRPWNKLFSFCLRIQAVSLRIQNTAVPQDQCWGLHPVHQLFEFRKKKFRSQRDATTNSFPCNKITWR